MVGFLLCAVSRLLLSDKSDQFCKVDLAITLREELNYVCLDCVLYLAKVLVEPGGLDSFKLDAVLEDNQDVVIVLHEIINEFFETSWRLFNLLSVGLN